MITLTRLLSIISLLSCILLSCVKGDNDECSIYDEEARDNLGFDGCRYNTTDYIRACFTSSLDVVYRFENGTIGHEIMDNESYIDRIKKGEFHEVISVSVAAMKCPEIIGTVCLPLSATTLILVDDGDDSGKQKIEPRQLIDLQLGDEVVVGMKKEQSIVDGNDDISIFSSDDVVTSKIINFAHRSDHDDELTHYVRVRTTTGTQILGSPDHNIFIQKKLEKKKNDDSRIGMTFGKLAQEYATSTATAIATKQPTYEQESFYLFTHQGLSEIDSIDMVLLDAGYVSPITESGTMLVRYNDETASGDENEMNVEMSEWIEVSCFSTVPDRVAKMGHFIRMIPTYVFGIGANSNEPGVGGGYWMDSLGYVATYFAYMMGYVVAI